MFLQGGIPMKCKVFIDKNHEEEVVIYSHQRNSLVEQIESLVNSQEIEITGYKEQETVKLDLSEIFCFICENNKVYAITEKEKYKIKLRLYQLEEKLPQNFVKLNQSCIGNVKKIQRFNASFGGSLSVEFKNGYKDYVSRRQLKIVKERFGF
ncbi:MAG: LytTR family transcriptional regulator [Ruminococcaceae bacterium]|nr:LytTR family transcriptional regulator [Oscillospiraceae bacterium]